MNKAKHSNIVYTALYDIGRESIDGRSFELYKEWLKSTVKIFPGIYIFHDGSLNDFKALDCNLITIPLQELNIFKRMEQVSQILTEFKPISSSDITFKTPLYSLVQYSKFELASQLKAIVNFDSLLWVDAGISRFIDSSDNNAIVNNSIKLLKENKEIVFEIDLRRNIDFKNFSIKSYKPGSCRRVISGTSFWINTLAIEKIYDLLNVKLDEWAESKVWDNEQVMLRIIVKEYKFDNVYVLQNRNQTGSVARKLGKLGDLNNYFTNNIISSMLER